MLEVLVQMGGLIVCGIAWRWLRPAGLEPANTRKVLTSVVYYLLLPALVLSVLWQAELGSTTLLISLSGVFTVFCGVLLSWLSCRFCTSPPAVSGAIILAATFPNVTYLGLPVLEATFGAWARSVAIQFDLFACTPLLFTLGVLVAARYGTSPAGVTGMMRELLRIPALWAGAAAVLLNLLGVHMPSLLGGGANCRPWCPWLCCDCCWYRQPPRCLRRRSACPGSGTQRWSWKRPCPAWCWASFSAIVTTWTSACTRRR